MVIDVDTIGLPELEAIQGLPRACYPFNKGWDESKVEATELTEALPKWTSEAYSSWFYRGVIPSVDGRILVGETIIKLKPDHGRGHLAALHRVMASWDISSEQKEAMCSLLIYKWFDKLN